MRGAQIAVFVLCVAVAMTILSGMGWFGMVGVQPDGNIETDQAEEQLQEPGASDAGSDEFSMVRGALDTLSALTTLTTQISGILQNWSVPAPIAHGIHLIVIATMGIMAAAFIRGVVIR